MKGKYKYSKGAKTQKEKKKKKPYKIDYNAPGADTTGMDSFKKMFDYFASKYPDGEQRLNNLMNDISGHETGMSFLPTQLQKTDKEFPPGRGQYQYETKYDSGAANSAVQNLLNYFKSGKTPKVPVWLDEYIKANGGYSNIQEAIYDFSKLPPQQQSMFFIADKSQPKETPFSSYMRGEIGTEDIWGPYHKRKNPNYDLFLEHKKQRRALEAADKKPEYTAEEIRSMLLGKSYMPQ